MLRICRKIGVLVWSIIWKTKKFKNIDELVEAHFLHWSEPNHQNRTGLSLALKNSNKCDPVIVETGTSAYGTDSSRLFDAFVRSFGGTFYSVDINAYPSKRLRIAKSKRTKFYVRDSVQFLCNLTELTGKKSVDLFYLDSWDVDWHQPYESAEHGRNEIQAIKPYIKTGTVLVIDDTPISLDWIPSKERDTAIKFKDRFGVLPGKGAFFAEALVDFEYQILHHQYNIVLLFK